MAQAELELSMLSSKPPRPSRTRQPILWALAIASLAMLIVAPLLMRGVLPKDTSQLPESVQGYARVDNDPTIDRAKDELEKAASSQGATVTAAVYRKLGKGLVVEVYSGLSPELTASGMLTALAEKINSSGTTIDLSKKTSTYGQNGVTQACAPMSGSLNGSVCYWTDLQRVGLIMGINVDIQETGSLADAVRQSVHG